MFKSTKIAKRPLFVAKWVLKYARIQRLFQTTKWVLVRGGAKIFSREEGKVFKNNLKFCCPF